MSSVDEALLEALEAGPRWSFADWPNPGVPPVAAGAYTVWEGDTLVYAGMAGRSLSATDLVVGDKGVPRVTGLRSRLNSHASGRRSGDQFCLYVCDLLVLPTLDAETIAAVARRDVKLDDLVRWHIRERFDYRFVETTDGAAARRLEAAVRSGALRAGPPLLNPM